MGLVSGFAAFRGRMGVDSALDEVVVCEVPGRPSLEADTDGAWLVSAEIPLALTGCETGTGADTVDVIEWTFFGDGRV